MEDVSGNCYYDTRLDYDNVSCFVDEFIKLEYKMAFYFQNTNKDH